jgi:hypothetical protein
MPDYQIFGGILRSELTFPELTPAAALPPRWLLTTSDHAPPPFHSVTMGQEEVEPGVQVSLSRHEGGLRLAFDDTGIFDISHDGARIEWTRPAEPDMASVRKDVLGRVLAVCLHQQGVVALHGSAVDLSGVAVAFLAPKFHGKSTTAAALVDTGARLLADDVVAVTTGPHPAVLPSVPFIHLWSDSAARVAPASVAVPGNERGPKLQRRWDESGRNADAPAPLAAVYLLAPVPPGAPAGVRRTRLTAVEGALALLSQTKVGNLLGVERRAELLQVTGELADRIPVYRLDIPRDFERLHDLTAALWNWHTAGGAGPSIEGSR